MANREFTVERLRELLSYDPATGELRWSIRRGNVRAGSLAGSLDSHGYLRVSIDGRFYKAHRLVWMHVHGAWPAGEIDHINMVKTDNRIANLRDATRSENQKNTLLYRRNSSGYRGVCWSKQKNRWQAMISENGRLRHLGYFDCPESASAAYLAARA